MLINFRVSNFASFEELQEFSMVAGKVRNHSERIYKEEKNKLLKFMAIYGANASGKSNLICAFEFVKRVVVDGFQNITPDLYCKLKESNKEKPSRFEFTILIDGKRYMYGFDVILSRKEVQSEWLYELTYAHNKKLVFIRDIISGSYTVNTYFRDALINERLNIYADDVKNDTSVLFLTLMNKNKDALYENETGIKLYQKIYNWFKFKLSVNFSERPVTNYTYILKNDSMEDISRLLSVFGTGVSKFKFVDISLEKMANDVPKDVIEQITDELIQQKNRNEKKGINDPIIMMLRSSDGSELFIVRLGEDGFSAKTVQFNHENTNAIFSLSEESDGTVRLLDLIEILLSDNREKIYIIDEINRRFHPLLTQKFVEEYLKMAEKRKMQLIVTTHESKLMDLTLLRNDEISFVDKDEYGRSTFFTMTTFGERFDKKVCSAYFKGEYGAIPRFNVYQ